MPKKSTMKKSCAGGTKKVASNAGRKKEDAKKPDLKMQSDTKKGDVKDIAPKKVKDEYDVIIAGAGPGGSIAAIFLAKYGIKTLLVDKAEFPRDKTCGDALSGKSRDILAELGLDKKLKEMPHAIVTGVVFSCPSGAQVTIPFKNDKDEIIPGIVTRREVLDNTLYQEAKKECDTYENFEVTDLILNGDKVVGVTGMDLKTNEEKKIYSKIVIGADGVYSIVARKTGAFHNDPKHVCSAVRAYYKNVKDVDKNLELHFVDKVIPGYFWIFPNDNGMCNVGLGIVDDDIMKRKVNLAQLMDDVLKNDPKFKDRFKNAEMVTPVKGWKLPFGSKRRKPYGDGWMLVGDAAALVDPFTGEGMGNAIYSGKLAAGIIAKAKQKDWDMSMLMEYENRIAKELDHELQQSYNMQKVGRHKMLINIVIGRAAKSKKVQEFISKSVTGTEAKEQYSNPLTYLKLLFM